nr:immunoglobulin heavy chain junction region [Macaca mulatta]MOW76108.1 immunoglobulin heavy chain junction region [Macaca mulatta]MOW76224.1 immunoglobulin heavy chain junction region [Macaca mulatta]MOW79358.1 immunoglobulin heavy chain junction region [Macaca mulatta]MOW80545.1 immunoglobulin heavy chain junction region [Macaca mulatta]
CARPPYSSPWDRFDVW